MSEENKTTSPNPSKDEIVYQNGKLEIPTAMIIAVVTCIVTAVGSCSASAFQQMKAGQMEDEHKQAIQVQVDIATMKNDIQWIKNRLSESDPKGHDSH